MSNPSASSGDPVEAPEPSPVRVALGFFVLPLLIVIGAVSVFLLFGAIAHDEKSANEYLAEVMGGGINEPWQGAFGLANKLVRDESLRGDETLARNIAAALEHRNAEDTDVRKFLVLALGRVGHPSSVPVLIGHLDDPDGHVRLNALFSLGNIGAPAAAEAAPAVADLLVDDDIGVRAYAAYVLGSLENPEVRERLAVALNDPATQVRWNSAVALARLGDGTGLEELMKMVDRQYVDGVEALNPQQKQDAMLAAIQALGLLRAGEAQSTLGELRDNDPDVRVREAARAALASINQGRL